MPMRRSAATCFIAASRMRRSTTRHWPRPRHCAAASLPARRRVLAIGDSVRTDLKGAAAFGLDYMFVISGIHAEEYGSRDAPDLAALDAIFRTAGVAPKAVMRGLVW